MSLDVQDWVWTKSTSKGTPRMVLLAIADRCPGPDCTAYAGTTMLVSRTRASRSAVVTAVDKLIASGELTVVEGRKGPRGETVYQLPLAIGHTRPASDSPTYGGTESGPVQNLDRSGIHTPGGTDSTPQGSSFRTPTGTESGPLNARERNHQEEQQQPRATTSSVTDVLRPLAADLDAAGVPVRWSLGLGEQRDVWDLVKRHGTAPLVEIAARRTVPGDPPKPARYWLKVWADLDRPTPAPAPPGSNVVPFRPGGRGTAPAIADTLLAALHNMENQENA